MALFALILDGKIGSASLKIGSVFCVLNRGSVSLTIWSFFPDVVEFLIALDLVVISDSVLW